MSSLAWMNLVIFDRTVRAKSGEGPEGETTSEISLPLRPAATNNNAMSMLRGSFSDNAPAEQNIALRPFSLRKSGTEEKNQFMLYFSSYSNSANMLISKKTHGDRKTGEKYSTKA